MELGGMGGIGRDRRNWVELGRTGGTGRGTGWNWEGQEELGGTGWN